MSSVNPPGGLNLTLAILALLSAALSIVGFIAHYIPRHQYGDFCSILLEINDIFADDDWLSLLPPDQRSRLYRRYCSISADLESLCYLVSVPSYVLVFYVRTALRLQSLRRSASQLKIELIALSQIERGKKIQRIMETRMSLFQIPNSIIQPSEAPTASNTTSSANTVTTAQVQNVPPSQCWWRWSKISKVPVVNDCECLPV